MNGIQKSLHLILASFCYATGSIAEPITLEIATIIPDGSGPASDLKALSKRIADKTNGDVKLRFQWGGLAGDDETVLAAVKDGKLAGALLAGQILSKISPGMRETERLFQFGNDTEKAWAFVERNQKSWDAQLAKHGLHPLGTYEAGFVYLVSRKPFESLSDLKSMTVWSWPKDEVSHKSIATLGGKAVDVPVQDTFKALSEGRIDMAYAPPIAIVALQWSSKITHMVEQPIAFAIGTFSMDQSAWKKLPAKTQEVITRESKIAIAAVTDSARKDNLEALAMLKSSVKLIQLKESDISKAKGK